MGIFDKFKKKKMWEQTKTQKEAKGIFVGFALLQDNHWDKEQLIRDLKADWGLDVVEDGDRDENSLVFSVDRTMASVALMAAPIPDGEAELNAANNYMWPEAVETAKAHQAHLMVAVLGLDEDIFKTSCLTVKLLSSCCRQKNILGVYSCGTVFEPQFYIAASEMMKKDSLPLLNWIWFGLYRREGGVCCYTYGMEEFGKEEMEVLDVNAQPSDVRDFLLGLVSYVLESDVVLKDGETIGFTAEDKHTITRSKGVSLPGMTLKIEM